MLEQRLTAKLGEHVDRVDSGIDEIAEDEIDDSVLASEWNRRLGAFPREGKEPGSFAAGEYDAQHPSVHSFFRGGRGFSLGDHILSQSALPRQFCCTMLPEVVARLLTDDINDVVPTTT